MVVRIRSCQTIRINRSLFGVLGVKMREVSQNRDCQQRVRTTYPQHKQLCKQKAVALRTSGEAMDGSKCSISSCGDAVVATAFDIDKRITIFVMCSCVQLRVRTAIYARAPAAGDHQGTRTLSEGIGLQLMDEHTGGSTTCMF